MHETELLMLYDRYANMVYRVALHYFRQPQDAEDAVQVVFLKLVEGRATPELGKERAFLARMTINHCKDALRSAWKRKTGPLEHEIAFEQGQDRELFEAIMGLAEKHRIAVYLHFYEGYTFPEIAGLLGVSPSAVSMRIHRAKKILYHTLREDFDEIQHQADI